MTVAAAWKLTGRVGGPPLVPPAGILDRIASLGAPLGVDPVPLLAQRAIDAGFIRSGATTCGGAGRLVRAADGWVAVNLARDDDLASVSAWLQVDAPELDPWPTVEAVVPRRPVGELVERAQLLAIPVAAVGEVGAPPEPVAMTKLGEAPPLTRPAVVVDLSSLWAGPLCTRLLADRGAAVIKVESDRRPDGARRGPLAFFDRLHEGKRMVALGLDGPELRELLADADVVVEASRARALRQLGIHAERLRPQVWLSITGYGRGVDRVAFGDDAAAAGGLVAWDDEGPCFAVDAVADPLTGVAAAVAVTEALRTGGRWMIDASMAGVAAYVAGDDRGAHWLPTSEPAGPARLS